jgi:dolichyl-phosphate-mannose-protein mannosyltransferase
MYNYHSGISTEHGFASPWYEWPLIIKPMWYYSDSTLYGTGRMTSIAAFGNPAVWWVGAVAFIWLLTDMFKRRKADDIKLFVLLGLLAQYLPWILVPRSMFIYHYFASIPFMILITVMMIRAFESKERTHRTILKENIPGNKPLKGMQGITTMIMKFRNLPTYLYLLIVILLFVVFYPVTAGMEIPSEYGQLLQWLPTWWFLY